MTASIADNLINDLFPGYKLSSYKLLKDDLVLGLQPITDAVCPHCGNRCDKVHETTVRPIRDVTAFGRKVMVQLPVRRIECSYCRHHGVELIRWLAKEQRSRHTKRLSDAVINDMQQSNITQVSKRYGLGWETVKDMHKHYLQATIPKFNLGNAKILAVDEFAIAKGHRYATIVIDLETRRCIYLAKNRTKSVLNEFFRLCGKEGCKQIQAVAMDQNASFDESVREHCPNAKVVYDLFHVTANYGREVISAIRLRLAADARLVDMSTYRDLKSSRWLLLRNGKNLTDRARNHLNTLLGANEELYKAYILKEQLSSLWFCRDIEQAQERWEDWKTMAMESGVPEIMRFCQNQDKRYSEGIRNSCFYRIGTSPLEGINNKIKVIKRRAYGYHDFDYFFYVIKAAFPGR